MAEKEETGFSKLVKKDLKAMGPGVWILKTSERAHRGIPDKLVCFFGKFLAIEEKIPGKEPDALQRYNLQQIKSCHGIAFDTDKTRWPMHKKILEEIKRELSKK